MTRAGRSPRLSRSFLRTVAALVALVALCLPAAAQVGPPSGEVIDRIRREITSTDVGAMDVAMMERLYALHPQAAPVIGQIMGASPDPAMAAKNRRMADLRLEMDRAIWKKILATRGISVEFTNQGKDNGIKSDLDYTLYHTASGHPIDKMIEEHRAHWIADHGFPPDRVEIAVMNGDDFYPDWRAERLSSADYEVALKQALIALRRNPEAYFVPGANRQQVHTRALLQGNTIQLGYDPIGDGLVVLAEGPTRDISWRYRDVQPQNDHRNALGNLIQNELKYVEHTGPGAVERIRQSKHFDRVIDEGLGGLRYFGNTYGDIFRAAVEGVHVPNRGPDGNRIPGAPDTRLVTLTPDRALELKVRFLRHAFGLGEGDRPRRSNDLLNISNGRLEEFAAIIDLSMQIENDKVTGNAGYDASRRRYFLDSSGERHVRELKQGFAAEAQARVDAEMPPSLYTVQERDARVLDYAEQAFQRRQMDVMAHSLLAGIEKGVLRDLTPAGALRSGLVFERLPGTDRVRAVFVEDRIRSAARERAVELALFFEMVNTHDLPDLRRQSLAHLGEVIAQAPVESRGELLKLVTELKDITTAQLDNFLAEGGRFNADGTQRTNRGRLQQTLDEFIDAKIAHVEALGRGGLDLVSAAEAEGIISDDWLKQNVVAGQWQKLSAPEQVTFSGAVQATATRAREFGTQFASDVGAKKAQMEYHGYIHLMWASSAVNLVQAAQQGGWDAMPYAFYMEMLNYMPDYIETPFTLMDMAYRMSQGDMSGLWGVTRMAALSLAPGAGTAMLVYEVGTGSFKIVRTYVVSEIDDDLVELVFRSRAVEADGSPIAGENRRARRNPWRTQTFQGSPPKFPLLSDVIPVDEDGWSDRKLAANVAGRLLPQFTRQLADEGLELGSTAWAQRFRQVTDSAGFDLPFRERAARIYEHFQLEVDGRTPEEAERKIQSVFGRVVRDWYAQQPVGYHLEIQGEAQLLLGNQEEDFLRRVTNELIGMFRKGEEAWYVQQEQQAEVGRTVLGRAEALAVAEKRVLATKERIEEGLGAELEATAVNVMREAEELAADYEPTVLLAYPFTYATQELPPTVNVKVRTLAAEAGEDLTVDLDEELTEAVAGTPSGWAPGPEWEERLRPDENGWTAYVPVTVTHTFRASLKDDQGNEIATDDLSLPVVYYQPNNPPFAGRITVQVLAEREDGSTYPYQGAAITLGDRTGVSAIDGWTTFALLPAGDVQVEVEPREADVEHGPGQGSATIVDPLATADGSGDPAPTIEVVLPYVDQPDPPSPPGGNEDPPDDTGAGGTGAGTGAAGGGAGDTGGGAGGGGAGGGGGGAGGGAPTPEELIDQLTALTSAGETARDAAIAACDYAAAATAQATVVRDAESWLQQNFPSGVPAEVESVMARLRADLAQIERARDAVEAARPPLVAARGEIRARDVEGALTSLEAAMAVDALPNCVADDIEALYADMVAEAEALMRRTEVITALANEACDYEGALIDGEELAAAAPHLSWVAAELPRIRDLAARQKQGRTLIGQAEAARQREDWDAAIALARQALGIAPSCEGDLISSYIATLESEKAAAAATAAAGPAAGGADLSGIPIQSSVVFLIDASGSMGDNNKMEQAKAAATMAVQNMPTFVEMAIIAYEGGCNGGWRVSQGFTRDKNALQGAVASLRPGGGTPMAPAVGFAQAYIEDNARGGAAQLMLLSDGQNDCGSTRDAGDALSRSSIPVRVDAIGFGLGEGSRAEDDLTELVGASGNGTRYSANSANELISAFRRAFIGQQIKRQDSVVSPEQNVALQQLFAAAVEHLENNDPRSARVALEDASRQVPASPAARFNLSLAYEAEGQLQRAIEQANHYLTLSPNAMDRGLVVERIGQLEAQLRETPTAVYDPGQCADLYEWARAEAARVGDAGRKAAAFRIQNAAQRGDCETARALYEAYGG